MHMSAVSSATCIDETPSTHACPALFCTGAMYVTICLLQYQMHYCLSIGHGCEQNASVVQYSVVTLSNSMNISTSMRTPDWYGATTSVLDGAAAISARGGGSTTRGPPTVHLRAGAECCLQWSQSGAFRGGSGRRRRMLQVLGICDRIAAAADGANPWNLVLCPMAALPCSVPWKGACGALQRRMPSKT